MRTEGHRRSPGVGLKSQHFPLSRAAGAWEGGPCARARLERRSGALGALGLPRGQPLSAFHLKLLRELARITCFLEHSPRSCALYGPCRLEDHPAAQTWGARGLSGLCLLEHPSPGGTWKGAPRANVRSPLWLGADQSRWLVCSFQHADRMKCPRTRLI